MRRRIAVVGLPYFGKRVAATLTEGGYEARYVPAAKGAVRDPRAFLHLARADLVYGIGNSIALRSPLDLAARARKRTLMHWVGSDVMHAAEAARKGRVSPRLRDRATHWADAPWLCEELRPLGIHAEEHPLPMPIAIGEPLPMPPEPRILLFLPRNPHRFYNVEGTVRLVDRLPAISFTLVGGYPLDRPNVRNLGYVQDMRAAFEETSCFLRLVHHDGLSHTVVEALSFGRHVIWNYELPGVVRVNGDDAVESAVREHVASVPALNEPGLRTAERYRPERVLAEARTALGRILP